MTDETPRGDGRERDDTVFEAVDAHLNVFALANGMDLHRHAGPGSRRVLEWYRDGMERRIHLRADGDGTLVVEVEAEAKVDGTRRRGRRPFRTAVDATSQALGSALPEAVEAANALDRGALE